MHVSNINLSFVQTKVAYNVAYNVNVAGGERGANEKIIDKKIRIALNTYPRVKVA